MYIYSNMHKEKMEEKKGKKSVRDLFFKLHFAWKKRELCDVHGGGGSSLRRPSPRRAVVWQCLFFSFSYFSCSLSARGNYTHRRYRPAPCRSEHLPPPPALSPFPPHPFIPPLYEGPTAIQYTAGTMLTATVARRVVVGGFVFKSFFLILTLTNTHHFIISCFPPPTYTHTYTHTKAHEHSAVITTIASYIVCICVRMRRTTLFHLS